MLRLQQDIVIGLTGTLAKAFLYIFTKPTIVNKKVLEQCILSRPKNQALITFMNHVSVIDEPLSWGILPFKILFRSKLMRWTLGAKEIMFTNPFTSWFFSKGQVLSTVRGSGIFQRSVNHAVELGNKGEWIHVFPQGKVIQTAELGRMKWGVARIILSLNIPPIILPIWIEGLQKIMPEGQIYIPRIGKKVTIVVGKPIEIESFIQSQRALKVSNDEIRIGLMSIIEKEMKSLQEVCLQIHNNK